MYKFYKQLHSGVWKYVDTFNSTLDPNYHDRINWCRENKMNWKLERVFDGVIVYQG